MKRNDVEIAADLYQARRSARWIAGDKFTERIAPYQELILRVARDKSKSTLSAALELMQATDDGVAQLFFLLAAAVELIEPSVSA